MRVLLYLLLILILNTSAFAAGDFQDLKFGTTYEDVKKDLLTKYEEGSIGFTDDQKYIWINGYELGDREFDIALLFDNSQNFYAFRISSPKYPANYFEFNVTDDCKYLSTVFKNKYGKPSKSRKPNFFTASSGYVALMNTWSSKSYEIYTGITSYEAEYYATAYVASKKMSAAFEKFREKEKRESSRRASGQF